MEKQEGSLQKDWLLLEALSFRPDHIDNLIEVARIVGERNPYRAASRALTQASKDLSRLPVRPAGLLMVTMVGMAMFKPKPKENENGL